MATIVKDAAPVRRLDAALLAARDAAERTRAAAEAHAAELVERARLEADGIRAQAATVGRQEGIAAAAAIVARAAAERDLRLAAAEQALASLAVEIARRVVGAAAERVPDVAARSAREAVEAARGRGRLVVRAHPEDARAVAAALEDAPAEVLPSPEVARGGVVIWAEDGASVDARLETRLELLSRAILESP